MSLSWYHHTSWNDSEWGNDCTYILMSTADETGYSHVAQYQIAVLKGKEMFSMVCCSFRSFNKTVTERNTDTSECLAAFSRWSPQEDHTGIAAQLL